MSANGRPFGVTIIGLVIVIFGALAVVAGIMGLLDPNARAGVSLFSVVVTLVVGLVYLAVAKGIFDGNRFSRLLVGIVTFISLISGIFTVLFVSGLRLNGLIQAIVALIILAVLYSRKASVFFNGS